MALVFRVRRLSGLGRLQFRVSVPKMKDGAVRLPKDAESVIN